MERVSFFFDGWEPVARTLLIGALAYAALVFLVRVTGKRTLSRMHTFDFIVTVALGSAFGRILTARSTALAEAIAAFALLVFLQYAITWVEVRSLRFARAVTAPPSLLFFRGRFLRAAMRRERVTEADLEAAVRKHGAGSFAEVEAVVLEADGGFAVVKAGKLGDRSALERLDHG